MSRWPDDEDEHALSGEAAAELRDMVGEPQPIFGESHVTRLKEMWGIAASYSMPLLPNVASSVSRDLWIVSISFATAERKARSCVTTSTQSERRWPKSTGLRVVRRRT